MLLISCVADITNKALIYTLTKQFSLSFAQICRDATRRICTARWMLNIGSFYCSL